MSRKNRRYRMRQKHAIASNDAPPHTGVSGQPGVDHTTIAARLTAVEARLAVLEGTRLTALEEALKEYAYPDDPCHLRIDPPAR